MDLSQHYEAFAEALLHGFSMDELTYLVRTKMNLRLDDYIDPGPNFKRVSQLVDFCERKGRVDELFLVALTDNPQNPKLRGLAQELAQEVQSAHISVENDIRDRNLSFEALETQDADAIRELTARTTGNDGLQALVVAAAQMPATLDLIQWGEKSQQARTRICSVGLNGKHNGTGFLIDHDCIITNSHVVPANLSAVDAVFDFVGDVQRDQLTSYTVKEELMRSQPRELDFTILRLEQVPAGNREFFRVHTHRFDQVRESIHIIGHSAGKPLQLSYGVVFDLNSFMKRLAYTANTQPGSSGSPIFRANWELAAIHHHGETGVNNHGIPFQSIVEFLTKTDKAHLLKVAS